MTTPMTCGEATMHLLARYGVTTVFGIPGVHTLDLCRGMATHGGAATAPIRHVQARHEQGAGFMAEGWARASGEPGVAVVISGPGVTNAATALGQCYADSLPMLLISAEPPTATLGKGWGVLHEITEQRRVTEPLTAFSATAHCAAEVPLLLARAFGGFAAQRPRPVHISLPLDVQAQPVTEVWAAQPPPPRPAPQAAHIAAAAELLKSARRPVMMIGGGAAAAARDLTAIAEQLGAVVLASTAAKGVVPDDHPLALPVAMARPAGRRLLGEADVILAIGTELAETDNFVGRIPLGGQLIRIDIDPAKINDRYPATLGMVADSALAAAALRAALGPPTATPAAAVQRAAAIRTEIRAHLTPSEARHARLLALLDGAAPRDTIWCGDACQPVYTGVFAHPVRAPRHWFYPAGYCALGNALPNAIGAKFARPQAPVAVLVGDGGFMFTMPELVTAAEAGLALPIILWVNGGLKQIQEDMDDRAIPRVGVEGINPDFIALARACHCHGVAPATAAEFTDAFRAALQADRPTVIVVSEQAAWLADA